MTNHVDYLALRITPEEMIKDGRLVELSQIPIHPAVFLNPHFFTHNFYDQILVAMPQRMDEHLQLMIKGLQHDSRVIDYKSIVIKDTCVSDEDGIHSFIDLNRGPDIYRYPSDNRLDIHHFSANLGINRNSQSAAITYSIGPDGDWSEELLALDPTKLDSYGFEPEEVGFKKLYTRSVQTWYQHNLDGVSSGVYLFFHTFAKTFNNIGLEHLALTQYKS